MGTFPPLGASYRGCANSTNPGIQSLQNPAELRIPLASSWSLGLGILRIVSFLAVESHLLPPLEYVSQISYLSLAELSFLC